MISCPPPPPNPADDLALSPQLSPTQQPTVLWNKADHVASLQKAFLLPSILFRKLRGHPASLCHLWSHNFLFFSLAHTFSPPRILRAWSHFEHSVKIKSQSQVFIGLQLASLIFLLRGSWGVVLILAHRSASLAHPVGLS